MRLILLLLFSAAGANATCHSVGPNRWYCPSTGDPQVDGNDAAIFVSGEAADGGEPGQHLQYACGDTIIFDSGATYNTLLQPSLLSIPWRLAGHCGSNKVKIVGSRAAEMPRGYIPQMSDIPRMVKLQIASGSIDGDGAVINVMNNGSGYYFDGFALTTNHTAPLNHQATIVTPMISTSQAGTSRGNLSTDIEMHHMLVTNAEQELFGPLEYCKTIECTLRGNGMGIHAAGINVIVEDSAVYGLGGFLPNFGGILSASPFQGNAGTGFAVNDAFQVAQGQYAAVGVVDAIGPGGSVTAMHFPEPGWGFTTGDRGGYGYAPSRYDSSPNKLVPARGERGGYGYTPSGYDSLPAKPVPGKGWPTNRLTGSGSGLLLTIVAGNTTRNVTGGTNADPTVITSPGISAFLGIYPEQGTHCHNVTSGKPQCTYTCAFYDKPTPSCKMVIVEGTPAGWDMAAGVKLAIYKTADSVSLTPATYTAMLDLTGGPGTTIDTTGAPPWGGTIARIRPADEGTKIDPCYNLVMDQAESMVFRHNFFENGDMTVFGANGSLPSSTGTITASTYDAATQRGTVTLTNVVGDVKVGDILAGVAPGLSKWCGSTSGNPSDNACYNGGSRTGKISSISGTRPNFTFNLTPVGPTGMDVPLTVGTVAQWEGMNPNHIALIQNYLHRSPDAFRNGKGPHEFKACDICLFDGNKTDGVMFFEAKNQGNASAQNGPSTGAVPWTAVKNTTVRNNWFRNGGRSTINDDDYELTVSQANNVWYENNFFMWNAWENRNDINSGWRHNTAGWDDPSVPMLDVSITGAYILNTFTQIDCGHTATDGTPYFDDYEKTYAEWRDNIQYFGRQLTHGNPGCWPNETTAVHHNVWIQGTQAGDPDVAGINASWPNNFPVPNAAAVGIVAPGAVCGAANWEQCALAPTSPFKGAASDGKDMGADFLEIKDHLNAWSEQAGLIRYEGLTATYEQKPAAFNLGATHAAITFRQYGSPCSLILYTDRSRQTMHTDTNSSGRQDCARAGNLSRDGTVTFVLGTNAALTANTLYAWQITTGTRVMVGEFRTAPAEQTGPVSFQLMDAAANNAVIESSASADMSGSVLGTPAVFTSQVANPTAALTGVKYYRWLKRNSGGQVLASSPVAVSLR